MTIYDVFFFAFSLAYLPYLIVKGKAHRDFRERLGMLPGAFERIRASRPIWIHAVSVGEVLAAKNFIEKLSAKTPEKKLVLSTTTRTGNAIAGSILAGDVLLFYFPLDFSFVVKRVVDFINPQGVIIMETEIWPNLILELSRRRIPVAILNGRISERSYKGYRKIKFFFKEILKRINLFCMQTAGDAERITDLGAPRENVRVTGNMKFDVEGRGEARAEWSKLGFGEGEELFVAGSTHGNEEEIVLEAYANLAKTFPKLRLVIAPRHIDRTDSIKRLIEERGFEAAPVSQLRKEPAKPAPEKAVLILDTFGELKRLYSLATVVFMGGSLTRRGGHNIVEPALFGKPIVFGRHMFNFKDMAGSFLAEEAAVQVRDKKELQEALNALLGDEDKRNLLGTNAKRLIGKHRGATERNISEVERLTSRRAGEEGHVR